MNNLRRIGLLALLLGIVIPGASGEVAPRPPNIVLIMADDVSPEMFACYGRREIRTPTIDRMAREGVMFRTAWASAICGPSRALLMTGKYGTTTGALHNGLWLKGSRGILKQHDTFGKLLKDAGYATAIAGKWHCGALVPYGPEGGFDEYCLWEGAKAIAKLPGKPKYTGGFEAPKSHSRYWHPSIIRNHELVETKPEDFAPDIFTDFICDFMERNRKGPFLAYYPMVAPHGTRLGITTTPLRGKVGEMGKPPTPGEGEARFTALNEYIDLLVKRILSKIEELGLRENTVVIFCADNGTAVTAKSRGVERGCQVPFIAWGAGIKTRGATDELMDFSDILPTLVDYAGARTPEGLDGKSLKPFLSGETDTHREWIYSCIAGSQLVRTREYMLEVVNPILGVPRGRLYHAGSHRLGRGYRLIRDRTGEHAEVVKVLDKVLSKYPPLQSDNAYFQSSKGRAWLGEYTRQVNVDKHLHNHKDYRFYEE